MIHVVVLREEPEGTTWEVRRDAHRLGTATTGVRRTGLLLTGLDVPEDEAAEVLDAFLDVVRERDEASLALDVGADDAVLTAALHGRDARLVATQMLLDLAAAVAAPARVTLRPMTAAEFTGYREHLVTEYAQDMLGSGAVDDLPTALTASERSTQELLPDGTASPGQHLWSALDGDNPVGILWIAVDGPKAFVYDIEVWEAQRRRGYGREVLDAGAVAAVGLGATTLGLNVFGANHVARALYERAGYATTERTYRIEL